MNSINGVLGGFDFASSYTSGTSARKVVPAIDHPKRDFTVIAGGKTSDGSYARTRVALRAQHLAEREAVHREAHRRLTQQVFIVFLFVAACLFSWAVGSGVIGHRAIPAIELEAVTVQAGDTVWSLSESHPVDGMTTYQVSQYIASINDIDALDILPGTTLIVPRA